MKVVKVHAAVIMILFEICWSKIESVTIKERGKMDFNYFRVESVLYL